jgi:hypothetical protein
MESLFPVIVVTVAAFAVKHAVDMLPENASSFSKVLASYIVSLGIVFALNFRLLASQGLESNNILDAVLTAFILSAIASKGVHPLVELVSSLKLATRS